MKALYCEQNQLSIRELPKPIRQSGETLIRVSQAGICSTDLEIAQGYVPGFAGILGHEFSGHVEEAGDPAWTGRRVTAEINAGCGTCDFCRAGMERCGRFNRALAFLRQYRPDLSYMISERVPLADALRGFEAAKRPDRLKIVITME